MNQRVVLTIALALVLAVLVVPFGGRYTLLVLLAIAAVAAFDIWWTLQPRGDGLSLYQRIQNAPLWMKLGVLLLAFAAVLVVRAVT